MRSLNSSAIHSLSIIIPVHNKAHILREFIHHLFNINFLLPTQFILVNDGSNDGSSKILEELKSHYEFIYLKHEYPQGKGAAIKNALNYATADLIIIHDVSFDYKPIEINNLITPILAGEADVVFGSRFKHSTLQVQRTYHFLANKFITFLSNYLSGIKLTDTLTGYKLFKADILQCMNLQADQFDIDIEIAAYLAKTSHRILEMPISYYPDSYINEKRISWKYILIAFYHLFYFNLYINRKNAFRLKPILKEEIKKEAS